MVATSAAFLAIVGVLLWVALVLLPWRPWSTREQLEPIAAKTEYLGDITVLIPARNESEYIGKTLVALHQQGPELRVIVVDDQSDDDTAQLAKKCGAHVISGSSLPAGWSGKLWALEQGLREIHTSYTLLLDADIDLMPGMVATLKYKMRQEGLDLISVMAQPPMIRFVERLLMPPFIFFFKLLYPFSLANKPDSKVSAASGGCILVKTITLRTIGAFSSLHDALIDDCTLAAHIKQAGNKIWIGLSHSVCIHRGYTGLKPIWDMVARTAFTKLQYSTMMLIFCTLVMIAMFWLAPFAPLFLSDQFAYVMGLSVLAWVAILISYLPVLNYYQRSVFWALTLPIAGTLYLAMTWTSALRYWQGERANWKKRRYESKTNN